MERLASWQYWFNLRPDTLAKSTFWLFGLFVVALFVLAFFAYCLQTKSGPRNGLWRKIHSFSLTNSLLGLFLLFCNYEIIPFFTARFILALWLLSMILWLSSLVKELRKIPKKLAEAQKKKEFEKYLP